MDPLTAAAVSTAASLAGSALDYKSDKKLYKAEQEQADEKAALIRKRVTIWRNRLLWRAYRVSVMLCWVMQ